MKTALVLIDIQNDYFPGGKMELEGAVEAAGEAGKLLAAARENNVTICHIRHFSVQPGATFFIPGTEGTETHSSVAPLPDELVIEKNYPNSFRETTLGEFLKREGIGKLVFAGMMTHMCVDTTVRTASDLGFKCALAHDACATLGLEFNGRSVTATDVQTSFMAAISGRFALVLSAAELSKGFSQC